MLKVDGRQILFGGWRAVKVNQNIGRQWDTSSLEAIALPAKNVCWSKCMQSSMQTRSENRAPNSV